MEFCVFFRLMRMTEAWTRTPFWVSLWDSDSSSRLFSAVAWLGVFAVNFSVTPTRRKSCRWSFTPRTGLRYPETTMTPWNADRLGVRFYPSVLRAKKSPAVWWCFCCCLCMSLRVYRWVRVYRNMFNPNSQLIRKNCRESETLSHVLLLCWIQNSPKSNYFFLGVACWIQLTGTHLYGLSKHDFCLVSHWDAQTAICLHKPLNFCSHAKVAQKWVVWDKRKFSSGVKYSVLGSLFSGRK